MPKLYIIAGCNGAGKTTASYTVLVAKSSSMPMKLQKGCRRSIPKAWQSKQGGWCCNVWMTYLPGRGFCIWNDVGNSVPMWNLSNGAHAKGYFVTLLYFWLPTPEQAIERVATRVSEGGHNIPSDVIRRRYANGIRNLVTLYTPICNFWTIYDNSSADAEIKIIASGSEKHNNQNRRYVILQNNFRLWARLK